MGRIAKALIRGVHLAVLLLVVASSGTLAQQVVQDPNSGLVYLVNNTPYFITCEIATEVGSTIWSLYPGNSSGGYRWIRIVDCW